jgi:low affinity Fe/Cu permease
MLKRSVAKQRRNAKGRKAEPQKVAQNGHPRSLVARSFDRFAAQVTKWAGSPVAFAIALCAVVLWGISGPAFGYSETWQLVINTGTTIVTFLMVFLIQQSQNKDSEALHLKLDELLIAVEGADANLVNAERLDEDKLLALVAACTARARTQRRRNTRSLMPSKSQQKAAKLKRFR